MKRVSVSVGSLNPKKIDATKIAFSKYFELTNLFSIKVNSGVPNQPIGRDVIIEGAVNRAKGALLYLINEKNLNEDIFGVGIEAGLVNVPQANTGFMDLQFCAIIDENEMITLGAGIAFEYPQTVINELLSKDTEIGKIIGELAKNDNLKNESGAIGFLSKNMIFRVEIFTQATICALLPRINEDLYGKM